MYIIQKTDTFDQWLFDLKDVRSKAKILARLKRVVQGNLGDHKSVGDGVSEMRIDFGPGNRPYFSKRTNVLILILVGGDKSSQVRDIKRAKQILNECGE